ncbi:MAG TPA: response regulator [Anaerolineae bacterium]|nr:response regulator [Anaerolineae bacterium]
MAPAPDKIRIIIVDDIPETRENVRKLLAFESDIEVVGVAGTGREGIQLAKELLPNVVLMDINMPDIDGITAVEGIMRESLNSQVIMMSVQSEADYLRRSMLAGARDFLTKPFTSDELISTIRRVHRMGQTRGPMVAQKTAMQTVPAQASRSSTNLPVLAERNGSVIVVFGPKGGIGTTTIAVNLAIALQQRPEASVALVDASLQFGDVGVLLNLQPTRNIGDLIETINDLDADSINTVAMAHASGIKVLLAPARPEVADLVQPEHLRIILDALTQSFDYVVVDSASVINEMILTAMDRAVRIVLVATPDIPTIKNARLFFEITDALNYEPNKIMLVLNKMDKRSRISAQMIEENVKHPVSVQIPTDDALVLNSINDGVPFMADSRTKPIAQAIQQLADRIVAEVSTPLPEAVAQESGKKKTGLFSR